MAALIFCGCETLPSEPVQGVKSVSVISAIGNEFTITSIGTTAFQNGRSVADISEWGLDKLAVAEGRRILSAQYDIVETTYEHDAYAADASLWFKDAWSGERKFNIGEALRAHIDRSGDSVPDAFVVMLPAGQVDPSFRGNVEFRGFGMYSGKFLVRRDTIIYASAQMIVIDGETFEEDRRIYLRSRVPLGEKLIDRYWAAVDEDLWEKEFTDLSDEQRLAIKAELSGLTKGAVARTLEAIKLTPPAK